MKKIALIITSVMLFAACENSDYLCECKYRYVFSQGEDPNIGYDRFESYNGSCKDFVGGKTENDYDKHNGGWAEPYSDCYAVKE